MSDAPRPPRLPLDAWLREAYADPAAGCPPPEAYLEEEMAALAPEERRRLLEHADRCPACAAERDLARLFDEAPDIPGVNREDLDSVVARLAAASPVGAASAPAASRPAETLESGAQVIPFPGRAPAPVEAPQRTPEAPRRARTSRPWTRLAAAALLALAAGLGFQLMRPDPPILPPPERGVVRGATVEVLAPLGELAEAPSELRWTPWNGAAAYRVRILEVDGTTLWEERVPAAAARPGAQLAAAPLPPAVRARLQRAVSYRWTVEALGPGSGPDPARLALSEPAEFRIRP